MTGIGLLRSFTAFLSLITCFVAGGVARADTVGFALVIGVDHYLGHPGTTACGMAVTALRDALRNRHYTVEALFDPDGIALRSAIGDFAAQLGGAPSGTTLIYFCGAALTDGLRLFIFPAATDPQTAEPQTVGIVLQAPLNALAGTRGTVYADLNIFRGNAVAPAFGELVSHLPLGLHVAAAAGGSTAALGRALVSASIDPSGPWGTIVSALASEPGLAPGPSIAYLPVPVETAGPTSPPALQAAAARAPKPAAASLPSAMTTDPGLSDSDVAARLPNEGGEKRAPQGPSHTTHVVSKSTARHPEIVRHHPARPAPNPRIARLQSALARAGCYNGLPNGQVDGATIDGFQTFQRRLGDAPTGVLTSAEIVRLLNQ